MTMQRELKRAHFVLHFLGRRFWAFFLELFFFFVSSVCAFIIVGSCLRLWFVCMCLVVIFGVCGLVDRCSDLALISKGIHYLCLSPSSRIAKSCHFVTPQLLSCKQTLLYKGHSCVAIKYCFLQRIKCGRSKIDIVD